MSISSARNSRDIIEKLYISMRHFFNKGNIKPSGQSGMSLRELLLELKPEIYGTLDEADTVELKGLEYVLDRLPEGIEECPYIHLTSDEGLDKTHFTPIIPKKRRRVCYRIDDLQMNIEVLLGRSEIYDILTHLTFLYNEADKIRAKVYNGSTPIRIWETIEEAVHKKKPLTRNERDVVLAHLASIMGRTFDEVHTSYEFFKEKHNPDRFISIIYHLGKISQEDAVEDIRRTIYFSSLLRARVGHHLYGEKWANNIKKNLVKHKLQDRKLHLISSNMHSVMNMLYAFDALKKKYNAKEELAIYESLSDSAELRQKVHDYALKQGMIYMNDQTGANIDVQIFDLAKVKMGNTPLGFCNFNRDDVIIVFDYAFGEQAFEVMDELLRPYKDSKSFIMNVQSVSIMGKAGILVGGKGEIMIPTAHIFEGTADNYPFENQLKLKDFEGGGIQAFEGTMISVLGTSLQNKDLLEYFKSTSWKAIGLEMEGAHYQKAIQVASKIRHHIEDKVKVRYAYYASDNPLETGSTLASGALGLTGVKPTYIITQKILEQILIEP